MARNLISDPYPKEYRVAYKSSIHGREMHVTVRARTPNEAEEKVRNSCSVQSIISTPTPISD